VGGTSITHFFQGQLDEVVLCLGELPIDPEVRWPSQPEAHHLRGTYEQCFEITEVDWAFRETGDAKTNPEPSIFKGNTPITDLWFRCNRLVLVAGENIVLSQAGDFFNFYLKDFKNVRDSDPIDAAPSSRR
jgi:hypothetical protein